MAGPEAAPWVPSPRLAAEDVSRSAAESLRSGGHAGAEPSSKSRRRLLLEVLYFSTNRNTPSLQDTVFFVVVVVLFVCFFKGRKGGRERDQESKGQRERERKKKKRKTYKGFQSHCLKSTFEVLGGRKKSQSTSAPCE